MAKLSDLPHEILDLIIATIRPRNEHLPIAKLQWLASLRLLNKTIAQCLSSAIVLSAVWLELKPSDAKATSNLTKRFSHRYITQHLTDVVFNTAYSHLAYRGPNEEIDARIRDFYKAFSAEVDCSSISTLSLWLLFPNIFQLQGVSLTGLRQIAVHRAHDFLLVLFARWCPHLQEAAIFASPHILFRSHWGSDPQVFRQHPPQQACLRITTLHLEDANFNSVIEGAAAMNLQPINLSVTLAQEEYGSMLDFAKALVKRTRSTGFTSRLEHLKIGGIVSPYEDPSAAFAYIARSLPATTITRKSGTLANRPSWVVFAVPTKEEQLELSRQSGCSIVPLPHYTSGTS